jgi:hypothetical protein
MVTVHNLVNYEFEKKRVGENLNGKRKTRSEK